MLGIHCRNFLFALDDSRQCRHGEYDHVARIARRRSDLGKQRLGESVSQSSLHMPWTSQTASALGGYSIVAAASRQSRKRRRHLPRSFYSIDSSLDFCVEYPLGPSRSTLHAAPTRRCKSCAVANMRRPVAPTSSYLPLPGQYWLRGLLLSCVPPPWWFDRLALRAPWFGAITHLPAKRDSALLRQQVRKWARILFCRFVFDRVNLFHISCFDCFYDAKRWKSRL